MATWTEADVTALKAAVASGVLTVLFEGPPRRQITYQDLRAMRDLLASMQRDVARSAGGASYTRIATRKGL